MQVQREGLVFHPGRWCPPKSQQCSAPLLMKLVQRLPPEQVVSPQPLQWLPPLRDHTPEKQEQYLHKILSQIFHYSTNYMLTLQGSESKDKSVKGLPIFTGVSN